MTFRRILLIALAATAAFATSATNADADTALTGPCAPANTTILWAEPPPGVKWAGKASGVTINDDGSWTLRACEITLSPRAWAEKTSAERCELFSHEWLHLYFVRHTATGLMATEPGWFAPCHTIRERVQHDLLAPLRPGDGVICGRGVRIFYCRTFTTGADGWQRERRYRVRPTGNTYAIRRVGSTR
jgi:hypothetical protein